MNLEREDPVNWSTLKAILVSPKHYLHLLTHPRPDSEALLLGRLTHALVYEPNAVAERYAIMPRFHGGMKDETARAKGYDGGKEAKAEWEAEVGHLEIVDAKIMERALGMRDSLLSDPVAGPMVRGGYAEQRISWTDVATGIECTGRVDHLNGRLSDLKTTRLIHPRAFARQAAGLHYIAQLAWYYDGCIANGITFAEQPAIIAAENEAPHDVMVLEFTDEDVAAGRRVYRKALDTLAHCRATGEWPGVSGGYSRRVEVPPWYGPDEEEFVLTMGGEEVVL